MKFNALPALGSLAVLALVAFSSGCSGALGGNPANVDLGCSPADPGPAPAPVTPTTDATTAAARLPATCGSTAYQPDDALSMDVNFPAGQGASLTMTFPASVNTDQSMPLMVSAVNGLGLQTAQGAGADSAVLFTYAPGTGAALDSTALQAVMLDVSQLPSADGDQLAVILTLQFADGQNITQTYSAPVTTPPQTCIEAAVDGGPEADGGPAADGGGTT